VKAEASKASEMKTAISSNAVGNAVGGTVTVIVPTTGSPTHSMLPPTAHAASSFSVTFALFVIVLQVTMSGNAW